MAFRQNFSRGQSQAKPLAFTTHSASALAPQQAGNTYVLFASAALTIEPATFAVVPTDVSLEVPNYMTGLLAANPALASLGAHIDATQIDATYTCPISILVFNASGKALTISQGMPIGSVVFVRTYAPQLVQANGYQDGYYRRFAYNTTQN